MLVLGRKAGQSLLINEKIRVQILEVGSKQVKIGVDAPREITVFRQELVDGGNDKNHASVEDPGED